MLIGLTGGPGAGKTLAAEYLGQKGAIIISGDDAGRQALNRYPSVLKRLVDSFGKSILTDDGTLDRRGLGRIAFGDPRAMKKLNMVIHPPLLKILKSEIRKAKSRERTIVVDAALIYEWEIENWFDLVLVITARRDTRIARLINSGLTRKEAIKRIGSQIPQRIKASRADYVIENNGNRGQLKRKVDRFSNDLRRGDL